MNKIAILTSGGDAPGMNCAIRSVVRYGTHAGLKVVGVIRGFQGLIAGDFLPLRPRDVSNIIYRGGTILKTARSQEFLTPGGRRKAWDNFKHEGLEALVVIGGDGSFTGAAIFHEEFRVPVIGIPGTIDNDINGTQRTLGFDTALNTAMDAIDKIKDTASSMDRIFIIEVMGRLSGAIAVYSALAGGAEEIILPGSTPDMEGMIDKIEAARTGGKRSWIIVAAEGADMTERLAQRLKRQNEAVRVTVIGHLQRGGGPSAFDRFLGALMGKAAVDALQDGQTCHAVGWKDDQTLLYPLREAALPPAEDFSVLADLIKILT